MIGAARGGCETPIASMSRFPGVGCHALSITSLRHLREKRGFVSNGRGRAGQGTWMHALRIQHKEKALPAASPRGLSSSRPRMFRRRPKSGNPQQRPLGGSRRLPVHRGSLRWTRRGKKTCLKIREPTRAPRKKKNETEPNLLAVEPREGCGGWLFFLILVLVFRFQVEVRWDLITCSTEGEPETI